MTANSCGREGCYIIVPHAHVADVDNSHRTPEPTQGGILIEAEFRRIVLNPDINNASGKLIIHDQALRQRLAELKNVNELYNKALTNEEHRAQQLNEALNRSINSQTELRQQLAEQEKRIEEQQLEIHTLRGKTVWDEEKAKSIRIIAVNDCAKAIEADCWNDDYTMVNQKMAAFNIARFIRNNVK